MLCIYCMKTYQSSFFDESKRLAALSRLGDLLEQLSKYVDFEIFRPVLSAAFQKTDRKSPAGRKSEEAVPPIDAFFSRVAAASWL